MTKPISPTQTINKELEKKVTERTAELLRENERLRKEIEECRAAEERVRESNEHFRILMEHNPSLIFIKDAEGKYVYLNEAYEKQFVGLKSWCGKTDFDFWPKESAELFRANDADVLKSGQTNQFIEDSTDLEGTRHCWLCYKFPFSDLKGKTYLGGIGIDATDRVRAEEALQESDERYRQLFENMHEAFSLAEPVYDDQGRPSDWRFLDANPAYSEITGFPLENVIGHLNSELYPDTEPTWIETVARVAETGEPTSVEGFNQLTKRWFIVQYFSPRPHITAMMATDITERKQMEEALKESEERWRTMAEATFEGVAVVRKGRFVDVNDQLARILGYHPSELLGMEVSNLLFEEDRERIIHNIKSGREVLAEHRMIGKDGQVVIVEVHGRTVKYKGRYARFAAIRDITERKQMEEDLRRSRDELELRVRERTAELQNAYHRLLEETSQKELIQEQLRESEERFKFSTAAGDLGVWDLDLKTGKAWRSLPHDQIFGYSTLLPEWTFDMFLDHVLEEDRADVDRKFRKAVEARNEWNFGCRIRRADGAIRYIWANGRVGFDSDNPARIQGIVRDVTEHRLLEEQVRQSQKMEAIGSLAGGIAHDFNNMLAVILGNAELVLDEMDEQKPDIKASRNSVEQIVKASKRSRDLVRQILIFSRKGESWGRTPLKLSALVKETAELLRGSLPTTIIMQLDIATDDDIILADPSQMQQTIMNIASNAAYEMRHDGGALDVALSQVTLNAGDPVLGSDLQPGPYVKLTIRDTGPGIPENICSRIFDPFFTTKQAGEGTGMGLAMVYGIVKRHQGAIVVESRVGEGATFSLFFPIKTGKLLQETVGADSLPRGNEEILVVDDEPEVLEIVARMLQGLGYSVTTANNGLDGLRIFKQNPNGFDLVITDHVMPNMTGIKLSDRLLSLRRDLPVILFTGYNETLSREKVREAGISELVMKPVIKSELAGRNGFHAFVARTGDDTFRGSWPFTEYRDDILYPISFDNAGIKAQMRVFFDAAEMQAKGVPPHELKKIIKERFKTGYYKAPERAGISYMLSPILRTYWNPEENNSVATMNYPHVMYYAPNVSNEDVGGGKLGGMYPFVIMPGAQGYFIQPIDLTVRAAINKEYEENARATLQNQRSVVFA